MPQPDIFGSIVGTALHGLAWLVALAAILAALTIFGRRFLGRMGEARVGRALVRLFPEARNDVMLPDGRGGLTQIDHLALTPAGILAVETKTYRGIVLGQAQEATWTQVIGRHRHKFQNPLRQDYAHTQALIALQPRVAVHGRVVFAGSARFPKGIPEGVCHVSTLSTAVAALREGSVSEGLRRAWADILAQACTDKAARQAHLSGLRERFGGVPTR